METKTLVGVKPGHNQTFQKSVMEKGQRVKTLVFQPGISVEIESQAEFDCVRDAIGPVLGMIEIDDNGEQFYSRELTNDTLVEIAVEKKKRGERLSKHQKEALDRFLRSEVVQLEQESEPENDDPPGIELLAAIKSLDPGNDDHWTESGLPAVAAVEVLFGNTTRSEIKLAAPGYDRDAAAAAQVEAE